MTATPTPEPGDTTPASTTSYDVTPFRAFTPLSTEEKKAVYFADAPKSMNVEETVTRLTYLLGLTDLFHHFIEAKASKDPKFAQAVKLIEERGLTKPTGQAATADHRRRKTEKEEDAELLQAEQTAYEAPVFEESPGFINGKMRDYQVQGLNWLINLHKNNISGILADEMGLGKTLQTISFLGYLRFVENIAGPHLVVVPKSTLDNWAREFQKWTPEVNIVLLQGDKESRPKLIAERLMTCDFDVVITSYEMVIKEKAALKKFAWQYIIIDEAHRIKNEESLLSQIIRMFHSRNRLLITGTPLQNNLHELWALLNFILPDVFSDSGNFDSWFDGPGSEESEQDGLINQLHAVLRPFLLRRLKSDVEKSLLPKKEINVYIGMSDMQLKWYQKLLEKDIDAVNGANGKRESKTRLLNIVMQLRKCCNHPYLFEGAEPGPPYTTDEHLVYNAAKMKILDKLLKKFQAQGSRALIFSQMSRMLDILEDYCLFRGYAYCRIDGQTAHEDRIAAIDDYNRPGSEKFVFLLTTRAGGLGINLTTADQVILYDSDWNPQADLQAMDRAHRIGQKKQVYVYRFITENAIEEKILERAAQKLRLDQLVIQQGRRGVAQQSARAANKDDLLSMIQHGAASVFERVNEKNARKKIESADSEKAETESGDEDDIDAILAKGEEKTKELNQRYAKLGLDDLQKFTSDSAYEWNGEDFKKKSAAKLPALNWINPTKRERKENYNIDGYYKGVLSSGSSKPANTGPKGPKPPKQLHLQDHQFYPPQLMEIYEKEKSYFRKQTGYKVPLADGPEDTLEDRKAEQELEQQEIDDAEPLTEEEEKLKIELAEHGFSNWNRRDFTHYIQLCAKHGRHNYAAIAAEMDDKTLEEVEEYSKTFWERYTEIDGYDRYLQQIEAGEERAKKLQLQKDILKKKVELYEFPLQDLEIPYNFSSTRRQFSDEEDKFILVELHKLGLDTENVYEMIRESIKLCPLFRFDWFFLSRTAGELSRRAATLLTLLMKEADVGTSGSKKRGQAGNGDHSKASSVAPEENGSKRKRKR